MDWSEVHEVGEVGEVYKVHDAIRRCALTHGLYEVVAEGRDPVAAAEQLVATFGKSRSGSGSGSGSESESASASESGTQTDATFTPKVMSCVHPTP